MKRRRWFVKRYKIDGLALERWFFKTAVNLVCLQEDPVTWIESGGESGDPPSGIVTAIFGQAPTPSHMGIYFAVNVGQVIRSQDSVSFALLLHEGAVAGAFFAFRGFRFFVGLWRRPVPPRPPFVDNLPDGWNNAELKYHMQYVRFADGEYFSQEVEFRWV